MLDVIQRLLIGVPKRPTPSQKQPTPRERHRNYAPPASQVPIAPKPIPVPLQTPQWLREHQNLSTILESPFEFPLEPTSSIESSSHSSELVDLPSPRLPDEIYEQTVFRNTGRLVDIPSTESSSLSLGPVDLIIPQRPRLDHGIYSQPIVKIVNRQRKAKPVFMSGALGSPTETRHINSSTNPSSLTWTRSGASVLPPKSVIKNHNGDHPHPAATMRGAHENPTESRRIDSSSPAWNSKTSSVPPSNMVVRTQNGKRLQVQLVDSSGPISSGKPYSVLVSKTIPKKNNGKSIAVRLVNSLEPTPSGNTQSLHTSKLVLKKLSSSNLPQAKIRHVNPPSPLRSSTTGSVSPPKSGIKKRTGGHPQPTEIQDANFSSPTRTRNASSFPVPKPVLKKPSSVYQMSGHTNFPSTRHVNFLHDTTTQNLSFGSPFVFVSSDDSSSQSSLASSDSMVDVSPRPLDASPKPLDAPDWNVVTPEAPTPAPSSDEDSEEALWQQASPAGEDNSLRSLTEEDRYPHPVATELTNELTTGRRPPRVIDVDSEIHGVMPFMILLLSMPFIGIATHTGSVIALGQGLKCATRNLKVQGDKRIGPARGEKIWCNKRLEKQKPWVNRYQATRAWRVNVPPYDMSSLDRGVPGRGREDAAITLNADEPL
ncbi:hypothetical protein FPQ18DRAFT_397172 [Pyronema domesticum]|nr:hypothetical protein FPQ18DRAFT_397172 [Pyronema domesticum]